MSQGLQIDLSGKSERLPTSFRWALLTAFLATLGWASEAAAYTCFYLQLPNLIAGPEAASPGDTCTACHRYYAGSEHNAFGDAFELALDCNAPGGVGCTAETWGDNWCPTSGADTGPNFDPQNNWAGVAEMYHLDSDGDGYRNALELYAGQSNTLTGRVRHPGYASSVPCDTCAAVPGAVCSVDNCNLWNSYDNKYTSKNDCLGDQPDTWSCNCGPGYTGDGNVSCSNLNACTLAAREACLEDVGTGNTCMDLAPPSTTYTCNCNAPAYYAPTSTSCADYNVCDELLNPCDNNGDSTATCVDAVAPDIGNTCNCTTPKYKLGTPNPTTNVVSCVNYDACVELNNPCDDGPDPTGTCTDVAPNAGDGMGNRCTCNFPTFTEGPPGVNGVRGCVPYDACTALNNPCNDNGDGAAQCLERDPPLFGNNCSCSAGYSESAPGANGVRRCLDTDGCTGAPCATGGDASAVCTDVPAGMGGGNLCTCSPGFALSVVGNTQTCVNINECADEPCRAEGDSAGSCTENAPGFGYACSCGTGYVSTGGSSPVCRNADACTASARLACADTQPGNTCDDGAPPSLGYGCTCGNAAYVLSADGLRCENRDECENNPCRDGGDASAQCTDNAAPATGYACSCGAGYVSDGTTCVDLDECTANPGRCVHGSCQNIVGGAGYTCTCDSGYQIDPATAPFNTVCVQENECTNGTHDCSAFAACTDHEPGWSCACLPGYRDTDPDNPGRSCVEIDECAEGTHLCAPDGVGGTCSNTAGSYTCTCDPGYAGTNTTACTNINECTNGTHLCAPGGAGGTCTDTPGSYTCDCDLGYDGDGTTACTNINECTDGTHLCAPGGQGGTCTDTPGSYVCTCNSGYAGTNTTQCHEIDECADAIDDCDVNALCLNNPGGFTCTCLSGYSGDGRYCLDIDECDEDDPTHDCSDDATCTNQLGSFDCDCLPGFEDDDPDNPGRLCTNIDECDDGTLNDCDVNAFCIDEDGSFSCACDLGFIDIGAARVGECVNIDECTTGAHDCDLLATCTDIPGSYFCTCPAGYADAGSGRLGECSEINECLDDALNACDPNATCTNTDGSYTCACNPGYEDLSSGTPGFVCGNIDECLDDTLNNCHADADCTDTPGSFTCACRSGYFGDGLACTNFNECDLGSDNCSQDADCTDTPGSFTCACRSGFTGDGVTCTDIDECADVALNDCSNDGECQNVPGSYDCVCRAGYQGDGVTCTDIDECAVGADACSENATCTNAIGSYSCACNQGFSGDGFTCDDIDECLDDALNVCGPQAACVNDTPGRYSCVCWDTYAGNGVSCFDVDECAADDACAGGRECRNLVAAGPTDPGYECTCPAGQSAADEQSPCAVVCGDGVLDSSEGCEGEVPGCASCAVLPNWVCRFDADAGVSTCSNKCSDGFVNPGEECDDGADNSDTEPGACRSDCKLAHCGDGVVDPGLNEECDDGAENAAHRADACRPDCTLSRCGDGVRDSREECDDGDTESGDGCSDLCTLEDDAVCQSHDAGPDQCVVGLPEAGVSLDAGLVDAGGGSMGVDFDGGIPPYAPAPKSTSLGGCSVDRPEPSARGSLLLWSLLGIAALLSGRRRALGRRRINTESPERSA